MNQCAASRQKLQADLHAGKSDNPAKWENTTAAMLPSSKAACVLCAPGDMPPVNIGLVAPRPAA
eukprot:CAMPEP_0115710294 /NCGR_PEP_ID=MMETSP0272-20121206/72938_1 /TAXON_ID=71861 /ORGANISM="Scrippsiella trochoidea, Strain CCMP3099" /LENGTH=63 /DNA_ID=CAMNT_0003151981 /DNA_START=13 /DNA_END=201 /DNA_ORIENTATION=-